MNYFELINELNDKYIESNEELVESAVNGYHLPFSSCDKYLKAAKYVEKALISVVLASKIYDDTIVISHDDIGHNTMLTSTETGETIIVPLIVG